MTKLIQQNGKPHPALLELAQRHGIDTEAIADVHELASQMQQAWLWFQYQIPDRVPEGRDLELLTDLGLVDEILPDFTRSDSEIGATKRQACNALILGGTITAVRKQLHHLLKVDRGVKIDTVYLLGSAHPLDTVRENPRELLTPGPDMPFRIGWHLVPVPSEPVTSSQFIRYFLKMRDALPKTEAEMMQFVFEQSGLPANWRGVFINTPLQPAQGASTRRPGTAEKAREFLETNPQATTYLVVSGQPFVSRKTLNLRQHLPADFNLIGIGYAAPPALSLNIFLGEIAGLLLEELYGPIFAS